MLRHFFGSNSRHGTHSPFVYNLAEQVIYAKRTPIYRHERPASRLINEIADYYQIDYTPSSFDIGQDKALYVDYTMGIQELAAAQLEFKYLVIPDIYNGVYHKNRWKNICKDPRFIVCVDLFYFGLVFYRTEQRKQVFKLRFPFWRR